MSNKIAIAAFACAGMLLIGVPQTAYAQQAKMPPITLDLRDAPIRQALEQLFNSANAQFSIDPNVAGFITLKIVDQPFENALKLIMRSSTVPLTYTVENNVYLVKVRPIDNTNVNVAPPPTLETTEERTYQPLEVIPLTYIDPFDLQQVLGVQILPIELRGASMGGGMMGGMGGMMGGMGGMGGGMMGGMGGMGMGGGMMGGMGGMGGGFMGGGRGF